MSVLAPVISLDSTVTGGFGARGTTARLKRPGAGSGCFDEAICSVLSLATRREQSVIVPTVLRQRDALRGSAATPVSSSAENYRIECVADHVCDCDEDHEAD